MPAKSGLGRGLGALLTSNEEVFSGVLNVPIEQIVPNPRQPRTHFDLAALADLAASIKEHGVIQPLIVSRNEAGAGYILIAGERRLQASKTAGLSEVPVIVRQTTDQEKLELALIENIQRADLNPLEEAAAYQQLSDEFKLSHEEISLRVGKSRVAVTNTMRLLKLSAPIQQALVDGRISEGHARALLALTTPQAQLAALQTVLHQSLTVRQTEELVRKLGGEKPANSPKAGPAPDVLALEERLRSVLGTEISLKTGKNGKSALTLYFYSEEELDALLERLLDEK
ncbi:MAG: ParB/RepB/Spo0J family partition protein [Anaerolineales bacterium]|jgi:ParB family chromosome partitioning protein|nr:ParB/RepB/Spo0J family partition protein [Anaerolineales bacterium]